jgi:endogenous inhibitor of DNA gyrase (YacG/DUF329 family)
MCKADASNSSAKPFCSDTCRRRDLGNWLDGSYRIIGERVDPSTLYDTAEEPIHDEGQR